MRALWLVRANLTRHPGGDTTQILHTAKALRQRGVQIDIAHSSHVDLQAYDVVHLFHLDRLWENAEHARRARDANRPIVLSTIYWPSNEFDRGGRAGIQGWLARRLGSSTYQNLRVAQRYCMHCWERRRFPRLAAKPLSFQRNVEELLHAASVLLPNSRAEQSIIEQRFELSRPAVIVPNAADTEMFRPPDEPSAAKRDGVVCTGRIEPRKNQLALIRALRGTRIPLTLVGGPGRYSRSYYRRCQQAADDTVRFVGGCPPQQVRNHYQTACVHVNVSWYETPGLASLEAALCGCAIVVTPGGSTREYLQENAVYAQPDDPTTIREAIERALERGPSSELADRVRQQYTWEAAAKMTAQAYTLAMDLHSPR